MKNIGTLTIKVLDAKHNSHQSAKTNLQHLNPFAKSIQNFENETAEYVWVLSNKQEKPFTIVSANTTKNKFILTVLPSDVFKFNIGDWSKSAMISFRLLLDNFVGLDKTSIIKIELKFKEPNGAIELDDFQFTN